MAHKAGSRDKMLRIVPQASGNPSPAGNIQPTKPHRAMSLITKFVLLFTAIMLLRAGATIMGIYGFQDKIVEQEITERLENAAESRLGMLDRLLYERMSDLDTLSTNPVFLAKGKDTGAIKAEMQAFLKTYPQHASITYFNLDRSAIVHVGQGKNFVKQHPLSEYWPEIYAGKNHVVNISMSSSLETPTLHFADLVVDRKGKTIGVLVARIPASEFYGMLDEIMNSGRTTQKYELDIMDRDGLILFSNHNPDAVLTSTDEDFDLINEALPAVRSVDSLTEIHRETHSAETRVLMVFAKEQGYRSFKGNGWILKMMYPADVAFAPVHALARQSFMVVVGLSLVELAIILFVLLYIVIRPIKKTNEVTALLGSGDLNARVNILSSDEIGKLGHSFNSMASNLKEAREQLSSAAETALARAKLAERKIIEISEETQQQIGRELHDDLGQQLTGIAFMAEVVRQHLKNSGHPEAESVAKITALINEAIMKAHNLAHDLYPVEMKETGLRAMLTRLANNTQSIYGIECEFTCKGKPKIEAPLTNTNVFRIVQEAVHNAVKHSGASKIAIKMTASPESMAIEVDDNGRGIGKQLDTKKDGGLGMHTMQYRASLLNAVLAISERQGGGTRVSLTLPAGAPQT
jgi:signal transduction histidine kinase